MRTSRWLPGSICGVLFVLMPGRAWAEAAAEGGATLRGGLGVLDWAVVAVYALVMLAIGVYYSFRAKTTDDYYLGGRRMKPTMVGLSLFATLLSTISYLAVPGEIMKHGPVVIMGVAALPIVFLLVGYLLIPYIMKLPVTSAYEILEMRFGRPVRLLGSVLFLLLRMVWMGLVVFSASKVVVSAVGLDPDKIAYAVIVLGTVTVIYSSMGGLQAVVLTDVIQTGILFIGALVCVILITVKMGGFGWFPTEWSPNWDTQPVFSIDPTVRVTVVGIIVLGITWWFCTAGSDQMAIQRYLATRDTKAARKAFLVNNITDAAVTLLLAMLGFALLGFFRANPQYLTEKLNLEDNADYLFPYFIVSFLRYGMAGVVISGMLAAAMSSLSSGVNSASTVINKDFLEPLMGKGLSEERKVAWAKWISVLIGGVVIVLGLLMQHVPGNLYEVTNKTNGLFVAPLFGLFFMAMFMPSSTAMGAVFGSLYGFVAGFLVSFWDLTGGPALSFQWILPTALLVDVLVGAFVSLIPTRRMGPTTRATVAGILSVPLVTVSAWFVIAWVTNTSYPA